MFEAISRQYPSGDHYLDSHHVSALKYIDIVRRSYIGITSEKDRVTGVVVNPAF